MSEEFDHRLSTCKGYRVFDESGRIGVVSDLIYESHRDRPAYLVVQRGLVHRDVFPIAVDRVVDVDAEQRRLLTDEGLEDNVAWRRVSNDDEDAADPSDS